MTETVTALVFAGILVFLLGLYLLISYRSLIRIMLGVEVISKGITLILLAAGLHRLNVDMVQPLLVTFIIVETILAAVVLAITFVAQRIYNSLDIRNLSKLKG